MSERQLVGMLMLGLAIGSFTPRTLPAPGDVLNPFMPFLGFLFLIIGIMMFIKG